MTCARGVPHDGQGRGIVVSDQLQLNLAFFGQVRIRADDLAIDLRGDRRLGQSRADFHSDIDGADAAVVFLNGSVGKMNFEHVSVLSLGGLPVGWRQAQRRPTNEISSPAAVDTKDGKTTARRKDLSILCLSGILQDPIDVVCSNIRWRGQHKPEARASGKTVLRSRFRLVCNCCCRQKP